MQEELLSKTWALEADLHQSLVGIVSGRLAAGKPAYYVPEKQKASYPKTVPISGKISGLNVAGNVRVIPIDGVMSRDGDYCSHGTEKMTAWIQEANTDPSVSAIVLKINSGGGDVDGTEQLGQAVRNSKKPVVAYVTGMAASAAYWVASQATEIIMETATTSYVGSIGVLAVHVDSSEAMGKQGYKVRIIRADGSEEKALFNDIEGLSEEVLADTKARLNTIRATFLDTVKAGRTKVSEAAFSGKMYDGDAAVKMKLADKVGSYETALGRAMYHARKAELGQKTASNANANSKFTIKIKTMSYPKLQALLGESADALPEETALAVETELTANATRIDELTTTNDELTAQAQSFALEAAALSAFRATGVSAAEVSVLAVWYEAARKVNAANGGTDATEASKGKKMSAATAAAAAVYEKLHGSKN